MAQECCVREQADYPQKLTDCPVAFMKYRMTTESGQAPYALRKQTVKPVFGTI